MRIDLPDPSLVVLVGASGCGKSSWAGRHFRSTEVLSSDFCRGLVADDENDQSASRDAFAVLHEIARRRLANLRLTVVDATNVQREARRPLVDLAREHDLFPVAVVLDLPEAVCQERNRHRADRDFGAHVVRGQRAQLRRSLKGLQREGFRRVWVLRTPEDVAAAEVARSPLGPTAAPSTVPSTSSGTSTAVTPSSSSCSTASGTRSPRTGWSPRPPAAARCSSATTSTAAPTRPASCGS